MMANLNSFSQKKSSIDLEGSYYGQPKEIVKAEGFSIPVYDFEGFQPYLEQQDETVYVLNFWSTWCRPCVEELPEFLRLADELSGQKVSFIFISIDFRKNLENAVIPFARARGMEKGVVMLNDPDANSWISKVDESWTGSIPATLIYKGPRREFHERKLSYEELKSIVESIINL